jgi:hypothetical protein
MYAERGITGSFFSFIIKLDVTDPTVPIAIFGHAFSPAYDRKPQKS